MPVEPISGAYDVEVHGPNGFLRVAKGSPLGAGVEASLTLRGGKTHPSLRLTLRNKGAHAQTVRVIGLHNTPHQFELTRHDTDTVDLDPLAKNNGWYDLAVSIEGNDAYSRRFAGHLEDGEPSRDRTGLIV